jgi:hypothetical protein
MSEFYLIGSFADNGGNIGSKCIGTYHTLAEAQEAGRMYWNIRNHFSKELTSIWICDERDNVVDGEDAQGQDRGP